MPQAGTGFFCENTHKYAKYCKHNVVILALIFTLPKYIISIIIISIVIIRRLIMESLHYLLMKTQSMFSHKILTQASKIGLTSGQPKVLEFLLTHHEADQKTIAAYCEIEQATVGSILLRMEKSGLIIRRNKDGNRRSNFVSLTESGKQAAEKVQEIFHEAESQALAQLSDNEVKAVMQALSKMCDAMQSQSERSKIKND